MLIQKVEVLVEVRHFDELLHVLGEILRSSTISNSSYEVVSPERESKQGTRTYLEAADDDWILLLFSLIRIVAAIDFLE